MLADIGSTATEEMVHEVTSLIIVWLVVASVITFFSPLTVTDGYFG